MATGEEPPALPAADAGLDAGGLGGVGAAVAVPSAVVAVPSAVVAVPSTVVPPFGVVVAPPGACLAAGSDSWAAGGLDGQVPPSGPGSGLSVSGPASGKGGIVIGGCGAFGCGPKGDFGGCKGAIQVVGPIQVGGGFPVKGGCGKGFDCCGKGFDACGKGYDACGKGFDAYGKGFDACGKGFDSCGKGFDACCKGFDACGKGFDGCGKGFDACGKGFDACGKGGWGCDAGWDAMWCGKGKWGGFDGWSGCAKGAGKGKWENNDGWGCDSAEYKYPGIWQAVVDSLAPVMQFETKWTPEETNKRVVHYITKAADSFWKDERLCSKGNPVQAQALIEELVEAAMGSISQSCHDREWARIANLSAPLRVVIEHICKGSKLFSRMLAPMLQKYVEDSLFRFRDEERIQKGFWDVVEQFNLPDKYPKKCCAHLLKAYDDAHITSKFGETEASSPELGMTQDFVRGWMSEFVGRSWDVLENGVGEEKSKQANFVTTLFQILVGPEKACLPHDLLAALETPPPANWAFVAECAVHIFSDLMERPFKQRKGGYPQQSGMMQPGMQMMMQGQMLQQPQAAWF